MATDDKTSEAVEGSWSPKRPRTPAEQRAVRHAGTDDPAVLAEDIEKTREELAETLDAIADRVSPKRVVKRTKKQAADGVHEATEAAKETAASATETVKETAASAAEAVKGAAAQVKETVSEKVGGGDDAPRSPLAPATSVEVDSAAPIGEPAPVAGSPLPATTVSLDAGAVPPAPTAGSLADAADAVATPVEPVGAEPPPYRPLLPPPAEPSKTPALAGAAAALAVVLLLVGRRRRRTSRRRR